MTKREKDGSFENHLLIRTSEDITSDSLKLKSPKDNYRYSPIFPVFPNEAKFPKSKRFYLGFYITENPFNVIANLIDKIPKKKQKDLWFSHGLASLIVFSKDKNTLELIKNISKQNLYAYEFWYINDTEVKVIDEVIINDAKHEVDFEDIVDFSNLDENNKDILTSISHSLNLIIEKSLKFSPKYLFIFSRLVQLINLLINRLRYLKNFDDSFKCDFNMQTKARLKENPLECKQMENQITGHFTQIKATLIALIGQAFTGTIPLLGSEIGCPFRDYSLLGIGTAFKGILSITTFIEKIFYKYPITSIVEKSFSEDVKGVDIFPKIFNYDPVIWKDSEGKNNVDFYLNKKFDPIEDGQFSLVYFSPRLGFRESTFAITVPTQLLKLSDHLNWNIITITHEIMHSHVHSLLNIIFSNPENELAESTFKEHYEEFLKNYLKYKDEYKLIDSLRAIIYNYCCLKSNFLQELDFLDEVKKIKNPSKDKESFSFDLTYPNIKEISKVFSETSREFDEIMTHVFDFIYFYKSKTELFLNVVWETWLPVPTVLDNISYYIFRSLLTISACESGSPYDRFNLAFNNLERALKEIQLRHPDNIVIEVALKCMEIEKEQLLILFQYGIYLVDMTKIFLTSELFIQTEILKDDNYTQETGTGRPIYNLKTGEFKNIKLESPIALLDDRMRRNYIENEETGLKNDYISAWLLLVLSSIKMRNGE